MSIRSDRSSQRGTALVMALAVLAVFTALGAAWMTSMSLEREQVLLERTPKIRAQQAANGGIQAAIADLEKALGSGDASGLLAAPAQYAIPTYRFSATADLVQHGSESGVASVTISDECARLNLNHATPRMLVSMLGISREQARTIRSRLPRTDDAATVPTDTRRVWLTSVDELGARGFVDMPVFESLNHDVLTVHSVLDNASPAGSINVNSAAPEVLAAVLDLSLDQAQAVANARPFASLDELAQAAGKGAESFNADPSYLALNSRVYRLVSTGEHQKSGNTMAKASAVAVVAFPEGEAPRILYWREVASVTD